MDGREHAHEHSHGHAHNHGHSHDQSHAQQQLSAHAVTHPAGMPKSFEDVEVRHMWLLGPECLLADMHARGGRPSSTRPIATPISAPMSSWPICRFVTVWQQTSAAQLAISVSG